MQTKRDQAGLQWPLWWCTPHLEACARSCREVGAGRQTPADSHAPCCKFLRRRRVRRQLWKDRGWRHCRRTAAQTLARRAPSQADEGGGVVVGVGAVGAGEGVAVEGGAEGDRSDGVLHLEALDVEEDARLDGELALRADDGGARRDRACRPGSHKMSSVCAQHAKASARLQRKKRSAGAAYGKSRCGCGAARRRAARRRSATARKRRRGSGSQSCGRRAAASPPSPRRAPPRRVRRR